MDLGERIQLVIRGLGRSEISVGALTLVPDAGMLFPLALVLAQRAGERIQRAELREMVWPDASVESGRHSLRQALYRLHKAGLVSEDRGDEILLDPALVDSDLSAVLLDEWPTSADARSVELASSVLPGFAPPGGSGLHDLVEQLRGRIAAQYRRAVLLRIAATRREGRWREVEHWALMCQQSDPLNEEATLARAEALAMVGAKYEALELLDVYLKELGERGKVIGLPARMLRRRISELADPSGRRPTATSAPFVGRHDVLARTQDALAEARAGAATARWLVGPSGIGKSRVLREIERASRMAGWTVVRGNGRPSHGDRPFALLTDMLPGLLDAPGALGAAPHALSLMRKMGTVISDEEPLPPEEARVRQHAVYHAWVELMDAVLAETPLALLLDDVHWSDPLTLVVLARFMESRPRARLAVMLCARRVPTRDDAIAARLLSSAEIRIAPLTDAEILDFTRAAGLVADERFEEVTRRLGRASGGNPLFLSHLVHQHQQRRDVGDIPGDLASLIDGQLRTLSREATRLLQACALLGQHARLPRIERALGVGAPSLVSAFGELDDMLALPTDAGVPLAPHDLWTERVRRGMTSGVFRSLAVSVARVLEADAEADGSIDVYWDAARLYQESGEQQLAYATMMRCAEYLMRTGAAAEASRAYQAASDLADTPGAATRALLGRAKMLQSMAHFHDLLVTVSRIRELNAIDELSADDFDLTMMSLEAHQFTSHARHDLDRFLEIARDDAIAPAQRLQAAVIGLSVADNYHDTQAAHSLITIGTSIPAHDGEDLQRLRLRLIFESAVGSLDTAVECAELLVRAVRTRPGHATRIAGLRTASFAFRRAGDYRRACDLVTESGELATKAGLSYARFRAHDLLAGMALEYGEYDVAHAQLREAEQRFEPHLGAFNRDSLAITWLFWAIGRERWDEARGRVSELGPIALHNRSRHYLMAAAARLRVFVEDGREVEAIEALDAILSYRDTLFRHSAVDHIAVAVAIGLEAYRGTAAAREFAVSYLKKWRRDRMPAPSTLTGLVT